MKKLYIILFFSLCSITQAQTTVTLQPDGISGKDAMLHGLSTEANNNHGTSEQFPADAWTFSGSPGVLRSVVEFDLSSIPANAVITSADLSLYAWDQASGLGQHSPLSGSNDAWIERITSPWSESTVTWNNQPGTTTVNRVALPASTSATQNYLNINVTSLVQDILNNPSAGFGFMLKLQNESYYRRLNFCSSDHNNPALRPKLVVTYTVPNPSDTCITLQPGATAGKDAMLHGLSTEANNNHGTNDQFPADAWTFSGSPGVLRSVVEFDLSSIPANAVITSADLSLYAWDQASGLGQHSPLSGSNDAWIERITSPWSESTVTWNNQPGTTTVNRVALPASTSATQNYLNITVTSLVQDILNNPSAGFGFMLKLQNESYYRRLNFCSSDHINPALRPKLDICYSTAIGFNELQSSSAAVVIYPNPVKDIFTLKISDNPDLKNATLEIVNILGETIMQVPVNNSETNVNLEGVAPGVYFYRIQAGGEIMHVGKVVKD